VKPAVEWWILGNGPSLRSMDRKEGPLPKIHHSTAGFTEGRKARNFLESQRYLIRLKKNCSNGMGKYTDCLAAWPKPCNRLAAQQKSSNLQLLFLIYLCRAKRIKNAHNKGLGVGTRTKPFFKGQLQAYFVPLTELNRGAKPQPIPVGLLPPRSV